MNNVIELFTQKNSKHKLKFQIVVGIFIIVVLFTKVIFYTPITDHQNKILKGIFVLLLVVGIIMVINEYIPKDEIKLEDENKMIDYKLNSLQSKIYEYVTYRINLTNNTNELKVSKKDSKKLYEKNKLDSLYIDANLIIFLFSIVSLSNYNSSEFYLLVKGTNNILKIRRQIEEYYRANGKHMENIQELFEISIQLKTRCVNNLHNFIYSVPKMKIMYEYIEKCINTFSVLLDYNLDKIEAFMKEYQKKSGINTRTKYIHYYKKTKPYNYNSQHFDLDTSKQMINKELIDLYI